MASGNLGCCGMDCGACEARRATELRDNGTLARLAAAQEGSDEQPYVLPSRLRCTGCLALGVKSVSCQQCRIRLCAMENGVPSCAFCDEYPCELGDEVWEASPEYKHNLDALKSR